MIKSSFRTYVTKLKQLSSASLQSFSDLDKFGRKFPPKKGNYLVPSLTVDAVVVRPSKQPLNPEILMITRKHDPYKGFFAFPGGFVDYNEDPLESCLRELKEETGLIGNNCQLFDVRGNPERDPREHIVTIFYKVNVKEGAQPIAADDAATASFYPLQNLLKEKGKIAFDHYEVLKKL